MPSLTTQSIGAASSSLATNTAGAAQVRSAEAATAAGLNQNQVRSLAQVSATHAQRDRDRVIQRERRAEGIFADRDTPEQEKEEATSSTPSGPTHKGKLNRVA